MDSKEAEIEDANGRWVTLADGERISARDVEMKLAYNDWDVVPGDTSCRDVYIRFGDIPEGEQSTDHSTGRSERGVSVYVCKLDDDGVYHLCGNQLQTVFSLLHRQAYLVSGERVGTGADGEPVIRDVEIEAELKTPKGIGGFLKA